MPASRRERTSRQRRGRRDRERPERDRERGGPEPERAERKPRRRSDLLQRILVAIPLAVATIIFIDIGGLPYALFMIAAGLICMQELYRLLERWRPVQLVGFAALVAMVLAARADGRGGVLAVMVAAVPVVLLAVLLTDHERPTVAIAGTLFGIYWIGVAFAHTELLRQLHHGNGVMIDVLVGTFVGDTGAYLGGRLFGRRRLAPRISPNKTVEGLVCGILAAIIAVFIAGLYQTWLTEGQALLLGVAVAVLGPLGDIFESLVKRDAGAKDAGSLLGSHGGFLDRLDGALFTVVVGYYIWLSVVH
jgi:phosphatidate cytidylyltransferase